MHLFWKISMTLPDNGFGQWIKDKTFQVENPVIIL